MPHAQHVDVGTARGPRRLAQERPPAPPWLEQGHGQVGTQEGQDEPGGAVAGADVEEGAGLQTGRDGEHGGHEHGHALGSAARPRQVDVLAPGRDEVEVTLQGAGMGSGQGQGGQGRGMGAGGATHDGLSLRAEARRGRGRARYRGGQW